MSGLELKKDISKAKEAIRIKQADKMRDCQFCPNNKNLIVTSSYGGIVKVWDLRNYKIPYLDLIGHTKDCLALNWHPVKPHILASGGMDKNIHIWNINEADKLPVLTFKTSFGISRLKWWDKKPSCIVSSYQTDNSHCSMWNIDFPNLPEYTYSGHSQVITGIETDVSGNRLVTCSKDYQTISRDFSLGTSTLDSVGNAIVQFDINNKLFSHSFPKMKKTVVK